VISQSITMPYYFDKKIEFDTKCTHTKIAEYDYLREVDFLYGQSVQQRVIS